MISTSHNTMLGGHGLEPARTCDVATLLLIHSGALPNHELVQQLSSQGMNVLAATTADQGVALADGLEIDAVVLESCAPQTNDFSVLTSLKENQRTIDVPIVVLSTETDTAVKVRAFELGAMDYVTQPFDIAELKARLRSAVRLRRMMQMLAQRAQIDGLTGLFNRAHFDHRLAQEVAEATRFGTKLSLVMCDLDRFKWVNDTFGHPFGDRVLETFARVLNSGRMSDIACRYGGEEFAVILPRAGAAEAAGVAERFRESIEQMTWEELPVGPIAHRHKDNNGAFAALRLTVSFGVSDLDHVHEPTAKALVCAADTALYEAKQSGRNRVCIAPAVEARK